MSFGIKIMRVAIGALLFALATVSPSNAQMKTRFNWTSPASNLSASWVAYEEGFFKKNGLEVEMLHIPSTSRAIQTMMAGEIGFSYTDGRNAVQANLAGWMSSCPLALLTIVFRFSTTGDQEN